MLNSEEDKDCCLKMAALVRNIGPFAENTEQWSSYTERFEYFVLANKIKDDFLVPTFLSVMGGKTFSLLHSEAIQK